MILIPTNFFNLGISNFFKPIFFLLLPICPIRIFSTYFPIFSPATKSLSRAGPHSCGPRFWAEAPSPISSTIRLLLINTLAIFLHIWVDCPSSFAFSWWAALYWANEPSSLLWPSPWCWSLFLTWTRPTSSPKSFVHQQATWPFFGFPHTPTLSSNEISSDQSSHIIPFPTELRRSQRTRLPSTKLRDYVYNIVTNSTPMIVTSTTSPSSSDSSYPIS